MYRLQDEIRNLESIRSTSGHSFGKRTLEGATLGTHDETKDTILFVDDSRLMRFAAHKALKARYNVLLAVDGCDALDVMSRHPDITAVITDLSMTGMDGYELIRRIRRADDVAVRKLPILVVSGSAGTAECRKAREAGADDLMTKPFRDDALNLRVERLLAGDETAEEAAIPVEVPAPANVERTRSGFVGRLRQASSLHQRHNLPLAVIRLRIQGADLAEDRNAGSVRDAAMRLAEGVLARTVRIEDTVGRTGSNEFMVLLPATTEAGARALRLRLREVLESQHFEVRGRQVEIDLDLSTHLPKTHLDAARLMKRDVEDAEADNVVPLAAGVTG